jgi:UDP-N-acetylglucosamine 4,6-dehydratase/5-epimerase
MVKHSDYRTVVITGGTGSFGQAMTRYLLEASPHTKIRIVSRSELPQVMMMEALQKNPRLTFILADVRDLDRLRLAFRGADLILHAAALKHLPLGETNPAEMSDINIGGTRNVVRASIDEKVRHAVLLSTDKAVMPTSLYGATKLAAERLFLDGNAYVGSGFPTFSVTRYGNVAGSRGSVLTIYQRLLRRGARKLPLTDTAMTRFWMELDEAIALVWYAACQQQRGALYVPDLYAFDMVDLVRAELGLSVDEPVESHIERIAVSPGEKLAEDLLTRQEALLATKDATRDPLVSDPFVIVAHRPESLARPDKTLFANPSAHVSHPYASDTWCRRLGVGDLKKRLGRHGNHPYSTETMPYVDES